MLAVQQIVIINKKTKGEYNDKSISYFFCNVQVFF